MRELKKVFTLVLFLNSILAYSQTTDWVSAAFAFESDTQPEGVAIDNDNNIISVGYYRGTLRFQNQSTLLGFGTSGDVVIKKVNDSGELVWAKNYSGAANLSATTVATGTDNSIYIAGKFNGKTNFDGIELISSVSNNNYFVVKMDAEGNTLWAKTITGISAEKPMITTDSKNSVYIVGEFSNTKDFFGTELTRNNGSLYLVKLDSAGNFLFVKQMGATGSTTRATLVIDKEDNVIITGYSLVNAVFGNDFYDTGGGFLVKLNVSGDFIWSKQIGGFLPTTIDTDTNNNIILSGSYSGVQEWDDQTFTSPDFSSIFVAKLSSIGDKIWLKNVPLFEAPFYFRRPVVTLNENDQIYFAFTFMGELNYEGSIYNASELNNEPTDIMLSSLDNTNGDLVWNKHLVKNFYTRDKIIAAKNNSVYITSKILTSSFDGITLSSFNPPRIIVAKIFDNTLSTENYFDENNKSALIYNKLENNYTLQFKTNVDYISLAIFDVKGSLIDRLSQKGNTNSFAFNINGTPGIYFLKVTSKKGIETFKLLKF